MARNRYLFDSRSIATQVQSRKDTPDEVVIPGISVITEGPVVSHFVTIGEGPDAKQFQVMADQATLDSVIAGAAKYTNGVKVKAGHDGGIQDIIGRLTNFALDSAKDGKARVKADLHLFKSSPLFKQVLHLVDTIADTIGFSVIADGPAVRIGDYFFPRFTDLFSTDLVTEASANPSGIFQVTVDNMQKDQGAGNTMTPEEISTHCQAAMQPHLDKIHARLGMIEQSHAAMKTKLDAAAAPTTGAPVNPTDDEAMYQRFTAKFSKDTNGLKAQIDAGVALALQDASKTLHSLGLTVGTGPASSIDKGATGQKKVEDMDFTELLSHAFALKDNAERLKAPGGKFEIIREVTMKFPKQHRLALEQKDSKGNFVGIKIPALVAA